MGEAHRGTRMRGRRRNYPSADIGTLVVGSAQIGRETVIVDRKVEG